MLISAGTLCKNSGWGKTRNGILPHIPDELQVVSIPVIEQSECEKIYEDINKVYDGEICAGGPDKGPCNVRIFQSSISFFFLKLKFYHLSFFYLQYFLRLS